MRPLALHAERKLLPARWPAASGPICTLPGAECGAARAEPAASQKAPDPEAGRPAPPVGTSPPTPRAFETVVSVTGPHLRAARALLGWAMSDLAEVSGLSLSTIRRLEQNVQAVSLRNRHAAVEALETTGIRFLKLGDGTIALAEPGRQSLSGQRA